MLLSLKVQGTINSLKRIYQHKSKLLISVTALSLLLSACKKDKEVTATVAPTPLATIGLYKYQSSSSTAKRIFVDINKIGTVTLNYAATFDTGSPGLVFDATGVLPASMITSSGIQITGDSVSVNGITVTSRTAVVKYGVSPNIVSQYGNLAYATVTLSDDNNNTVTTKRIAFFLYYKIVDSDGTTEPAHSGDVFGVSTGSNAFTEVVSPLDGFKLPTNVTSGFKLSAISNSNFSPSLYFQSNLLTIGLVPNDLSSAGGFTMHPLTYVSGYGYLPNIPATITYGGKSISTEVVFDTGNPSTAIIEDRTASALGQLPANTSVTVTTTKGFSYTYTTSSTANLTEVLNPNVTGDYRSVLAIDFFFTNLYLTDYANHQIGLKKQ
ncbi:hypothetical protein HH214_00620 [Mucilaginibacter robiniae]|uniref:Uncharacterized protein n=1 Tax=Mucilaginibacter robiniae TaxID=2728022 RepID=A0A7L5E294_9SPHI|nr:hypothetical protein [Mucilaginibacter robiniae]QJD94476.1 hypothetical protein HH214_00620 [Mucilaginibacter robiniae]